MNYRKFESACIYVWLAFCLTLWGGAAGAASTDAPMQLEVRFPFWQHVDTRTWDITVTAEYTPANPDAPGAKAQALSLNCRSEHRDSRAWPGIPLIPCLNMELRRIERTWTENDLIREPDRLMIPMPVTLQDQTLFWLRSIKLEAKGCGSAVCPRIQMEQPVYCWSPKEGEEKNAEDTGTIDQTFGQTPYQTAFLRWISPSENRRCGLSPYRSLSWYRREVLEVIRQPTSNLMPNEFLVLPTRDGDWRPSRAYRGRAEPFEHLPCMPSDMKDRENPKLMREQELNGEDFSQEPSWTHGPKADLAAAWHADGMLRWVWVYGGQEKPMQPYKAVRYYEFCGGELVQASFKEPGGKRELWRFVDREPVEYFRLQEKGSGQERKRELVEYWNADVQALWPEYQRSQPDMAAFQARLSEAERLAKRLSAESPHK